MGLHRVIRILQARGRPDDHLPQTCPGVPCASIPLSLSNTYWWYQHHAWFKGLNFID